MAKQILREIRIRTVTPGVPAGETLRFYVVQESDAVIEIDNRAPDPRFRICLFLSKMPSGLLENSAGQQFEIVPQENK